MTFPQLIKKKLKIKQTVVNYEPLQLITSQKITL